MNNTLRLLPVLFFVVFTLLYSCKKESNPHAQHPVQDSVVTPLPYPLDSLVGVYYVTGYSQGYSFWGSDTFPVQPFTGYDTILDGGSNELLVKGVYLSNMYYYYEEPQPLDSVSKCTFYIGTARTAQSALVFNKPYDDSILIDGYFSPNPIYGTNYHIQGKKVH